MLEKGILPFIQQGFRDVSFPADLSNDLLAPHDVEHHFRFAVWCKGATFVYEFWSHLRYETSLLGCPEFPPHYNHELRTDLDAAIQEITALLKSKKKG